MGIGGGDLRLLIWMREEGHIPDGVSVCEIGAQQLSNDFLSSRSDLETARRLFAVDQPCPVPLPLPSASAADTLEPLDSAAPFARDFWTWLGFSYSSIDIDGSPGSIPLDLNYDQVPTESKGKYRIVTNFGTTEHVVNQLNAFKVIHDLTGLGGLMMHTLPAQGMLNHGFVNYNPKFFWMLARSNGYRVLHMNFGFSPATAGLPANIIDYISQFVPDAIDKFNAYSVSDCGMTVILQKLFDIEYVAPLDVSTGTQTDNRSLQERYWTVFEPNAFERLPERQRANASARLISRIRRKLFG